jgi:glycerophosphoryl diester phosphodiesterase
MAAFRTAVELGARFIETDLQVSSDSRFVAMHDATLDRTTNGKGKVSGHTLNQLQQMDAGWWFDRNFAGERVPTLEEILAFARAEDVVFFLEIKYENAPLMHSALLEVLRKHGDIGRVMILCFDPNTLETLRQLDASTMTGLLVEAADPDPVGLALKIGARQLCPKADLVGPALIERAHQEDLRVATWTVNKALRMRGAMASGVDGIMTDFPDRLRAVIEDSRLSKRAV